MGNADNGTGMSRRRFFRRLPTELKAYLLGLVLGGAGGYIGGTTHAANGVAGVEVEVSENELRRLKLLFHGGGSSEFTHQEPLPEDYRHRRKVYRLDFPGEGEVVHGTVNIVTEGYSDGNTPPLQERPERPPGYAVGGDSNKI